MLRCSYSGCGVINAIMHHILARAGVEIWMWTDCSCPVSGGSGGCHLGELCGLVLVLVPPWWWMWTVWTGGAGPRSCPGHMRGADLWPEPIIIYNVRPHFALQRSNVNDLTRKSVWLVLTALTHSRRDPASTSPPRKPIHWSLNPN